MKKLLIMAVLAVLSLNFAHGWEQLTIAGTTGSNTVDLLHPEEGAFDDSGATYCSFASGSAEGWIQADLNDESLLAGLKIQGTLPAGTRMFVEFLKDGAYMPFAGSLNTQGPQYGEFFIDLSYDNIVAQTIRFRLSGADLSQVNLNDIKILGSANLIRLEKIKPASVRGNTKNSRFATEQNLIDGYAGTFWMSEKNQDIKPIAGKVWDLLGDRFWFTDLAGKRDTEPADKGKAVFTFESPRKLSYVYLYVTPGAAGILDVKANLSNAVVVLDTLDTGMRKGWQKVAVSDVLEDIVSIEMHYYGDVSDTGGIGEVELWGEREYAGDDYIAVSPVSMTGSDGVKDFVFDLDAPAPGETVELEYALDNAIPDTHEIELNGETKTAEKKTVFDGVTVYSLKLRAHDFVADGNVFHYGTAQVNSGFYYARLRKRANDGKESLLDDTLGDGNATSSAGLTGVKDYPLGGIRHIDAITVTGTEGFSCRVSYMTAGGYTEYILDTVNGQTLTGEGLISTDAIQVEVLNGNACEVSFRTHPSEDIAPDITLYYPDEYLEEMTFAESLLRSVVGKVSDRDATVTINGIEANKWGSVFWLPIRQIVPGLESGLYTVQLTATDSKGRSTTYLLNIVVNKLPLEFHVDNTGTLNHATGTTFNITGYMKLGNAKVTINNEEAVLTDGAAGRKLFDHEVALAEGLNLFQVKLVLNPTGTVLKIAVVRVFRHAETLQLSVESPLDGEYLNTSTVQVTGNVSGAGDVSVTVNGVPCTVEGTTYVSPPIFLTSGPNTLTVAATDALGQTAQQTVAVIRDTVKPVISGVTPVDAVWVSLTDVLVSGQVDEDNDFTVFVNGNLAERNGTLFQYSLQLNEGPNPVVISAKDRAGNVSEPWTFTINVDTVDPESFLLEITPLTPYGWTNAETITVSFPAEDNEGGSGIDYYEVMYNGASHRVEGKNYYEIKDLTEDDIYPITVDAYDLAGNKATATGEIKIDRTVPEAPGNFRGVPGNGKITVKSMEHDLDVKEYHIERLPAWDEGEKTITDFELREEEKPDGSIVQYQEFAYTDETVAAGYAYAYRIWVVDKAGNVSEKSDSGVSLVGYTIEPYNDEDGTVVEYDNVVLMIPKESLPADVKSLIVTEVQSDYMTDKADFGIVGSIYRFTSVQEIEGQNFLVHDVGFEKEYLGVIRYNESDIPEEFPEINLGVYYFDTQWARWFKVEKSVVDAENNTIYFSTNHFTDFSVQPTVVEDLSPQELADSGYSPFKTQVEHTGVTVSPQGGSASIEKTELVLPGRNGFDFVLKRMYDTGTARGDAFGLSVNAAIKLNFASLWGDFAAALDLANMAKSGLTQASAQIEDLLKRKWQNAGDYAYSLGLGWRLNLPYIRGSNSSVLVRLPDGNFYSIMTMKQISNENILGGYRKVLFENHDGTDFTFEVEQMRTDFDITSLYSTAESWDSLDKAGYALSENFTDAAGLISSLIPQLPGWQVIRAKLWLKDGTYYEFDYRGRVRKMVDPTGKNVIVVHYTGADDDGDCISYIEDSMHRKIRFEYETGLSLQPLIKRIYVEDPGQTDPAKIRQITYSYPQIGFLGFEIPSPVLTESTDIGGRTYKYDYDFKFLFSGNIGVKVNVLMLILNFLPGGPAIAEAISAITGLSVLTLHGSVRSEWVFLVKECEGPGIGYVKINTKAEAVVFFKVEAADFIFGFIPTAADFTLELQQRLLTDLVEVYERRGAALEKRTTYSYSLTRGAYNQYYVSQSTVNDGRIRTVYDFSYRGRTWCRYIDWSDYVVEQINSRGVTQFIVQFEIEPYNTLISTYSVIPGTLIEKTIFNYDYVDVNLGILQKQWEIKSQETWRSDTNYRKMQYEYDNWGNVTKTTDTMETGDRVNETVSWSLYFNTSRTAFPYAAQAKSNPLTSEQFPGYMHGLPIGQVILNNIPTVDGNGAEQYIHSYFAYNQYGQKTTEALFVDDDWIITNYEYNDTFGRMTKIIYPDGHNTELQYDDAEIPDIYIMTKIEQDVTDIDNQTNDIVTKAVFDYLTGQKIWEMNPKGFITEFAYDKLGRMIATKLPGINDTTSVEPNERLDPSDTSNSLRIIYDDVNLTSTTFNSLGAEAEYFYDNLKRLKNVEKKNRLKNSDNTFTGEIETITKIISYNKYGEITGVTDPLGQTTEYDYDPMGRIIRITYPAKSGESNPVKIMNYNYVTNTQTTIDENGHKSDEIFDMKNNMIETKYYDLNSQYSYSEKVYYDGLGNKVIVENGNQERIVYEYDSRKLLTKTLLPSDTYYNTTIQSDQTFSSYTRSQYNNRGIKTDDYILDFNGEKHLVHYDTDEIGRVIKTTKYFTDYDGMERQTIEKRKYDTNGNILESFDGNNNKRKAVYNSRDLVIEQEILDTERLIKTTYTYDSEGNKLSMTDPRGNAFYTITATFSIEYVYDDLNRVIFGTLPKGVNEIQDKIVRLAYDLSGNVTEREEADGGLTINTYTPRNWVETETRYHNMDGVDEKHISVNYEYDRVGNKTKAIDALGRYIRNDFDAQNRVLREFNGNELKTSYTYDKMGNVEKQKDGNGKEILYTYNKFKKVLTITDPYGKVTTNKYDVFSNLAKTVDPRGVSWSYVYDEMGRVKKEIDDSLQETVFRYDGAGNIAYKKDPRNTEFTYTYNTDNTLDSFTAVNGNQSQSISYDYDEAGNLKSVTEDGKSIYYNRINGVYVPDPFSRMYKTETCIDSMTLGADYSYDIMNRLIGVTYNTGGTVTYSYNQLDQLTGVPGYIDAGQIYYYANGLTQKVVAHNGIVQTFGFDDQNRLSNHAYPGIKEYSFKYDGNNNITKKTLNGDENLYSYDELNRLVSATNRGNFEIDVTKKTTPQTVGKVETDYGGEMAIDFTIDDVELKLDYNAMSIGVDLGNPEASVSRINLAPLSAAHSIGKRNLTVYTADSNSTEINGAEVWHEADRGNWEVLESENGSLEIRFVIPVPGRYVKVHCYKDDRGLAGQPIDLSTFKNLKESIITLYYTVGTLFETYTYDDSSNRATYGKQIPGESNETMTYTYYAGTNRLKSDSKWGYNYDANGNLTEKGEVFIESSGPLVFDIEQGEYWCYTYDLLNRMISVRHGKNGKNSAVIVAEYTYDPNGMRIKKTANTEDGIITTYYGYDNNGAPLYKTEVETGKTEEYVYVLGKYFALNIVKGPETKQYFLSTDYLGSVTAMTDTTGKLVWQNEFLAFGNEAGGMGFISATRIYTGKEYDDSVALYYFNARWMDPKTGRFVSIDPMRDGTNWYAYALNNPFIIIDPTGMITGGVVDYWKDDPSYRPDRDDEQYIPVANYVNDVLEKNLPSDFHVPKYIADYIMAESGYGDSKTPGDFDTRKVNRAIAKYMNVYFHQLSNNGKISPDIKTLYQLSNETTYIFQTFYGVIGTEFDSWGGISAEGYKQAVAQMKANWGMVLSAFAQQEMYENWAVNNVFPDGDVRPIDFRGWYKYSSSNNVTEVNEFTSTNTGGYSYSYSMGDAAVAGKLDWSIVSKTGETRIQHVAQHELNNLQKLNQGVFYGNSTEVINNAWLNKGNLQPITQNGVDIYQIPFGNAGYAGGYAGQGQNLNFVTIITQQGTNKIITGFPSFGN